MCVPVTDGLPHRPTPLRPEGPAIANQVFSPSPGNRRGANSTRPHERDREAPMREARQAAPDGARASAALSSSESSRFSRGTEPLRRKWFCLFVTSSVYGNPIQKHYCHDPVLTATHQVAQRQIAAMKNLEARSPGGRRAGQRRNGSASA